MTTSWYIRLRMLALDILDLVAFLVFVTWLVLFVRFFVFNPYTVIWQSMEPMFHENDFIIVDKITPRWWEIKRGDIVVFVPKNKTLPFIKRVIGLPGEFVKLVDGDVYICDDEEATPEDDCEKLEEYYLPDDLATTASACQVTDFEVKPGGYFVMWDNRDHSTDSRCCFWLGCYSNSNYLVYPEDMIGRVLMRVYPSLDGYW